MKQELKYLICVIENYSERYKMPAKEVLFLFEKYGIDDLLMDGYFYYSHSATGEETAHRIIQREQEKEKARQSAKNGRKND